MPLKWHLDRLFFLVLFRQVDFGDPRPPIDVPALDDHENWFGKSAQRGKVEFLPDVGLVTGNRRYHDGIPDV